jgi:pentapeptide MXKDX repeat protein
MHTTSKLAVAALSIGLALQVGMASAMDDMKKDTMGKESAGAMKKDAMAGDCAGKAGMGKDAMAGHDGMKKDSAGHDATAKDAMKMAANDKDCVDGGMHKDGKDAMKGDAMVKDAMKGDAMGKDAAKK